MDYFNLPYLRTGRILFATGLIEKALPADAADPLRAQLARTVAQAKAHRVDELAWDDRDTSTARGDASAHDRDADEVIAQIAQVCQALAPLGDGNPMGKAAQTILSRAFPRGVGKVVQLNFEEEIAWIDDFLALVTEGALAAAAQALPLQAFIERLQGIAPLYRAELEKAEAPLTHAQVVEGRRVTREAVVDLVAHIRVFGPDHETREAWLAPLSFQIRSHREKRRGRRNVATDVDPQTGVEVEIASGDPSS